MKPTDRTTIVCVMVSELSHHLKAKKKKKKKKKEGTKREKEKNCSCELNAESNFDLVSAPTERLLRVH